jgi:hypothetical protein
MKDHCRPMHWLLESAACVVLIACSSAVEKQPSVALHKPGPGGPPMVGQDVGPSVSPRVSFDVLADVFGVVDAGHRGAQTADVAGYRAWVKERLRDPAFYPLLVSKLLPRLMINYDQVDLVNPVRLVEGTSKRLGKFYYRLEPCSDRELEHVQPWWSPGTTALVCHRDHLPAVLKARDGRSCDQTYHPIPPETGCGCGPNLMFCATEDLAQKLANDADAELAQTMQAVITSGRPFGDLLTMNETARSGLVDLFYARTEFFRSGHFTLPDLNAPPVLRPRAEPFEGGILTTPRIVNVDTLRTIIHYLWDDLLCAQLHGSGVTTDGLLALHEVQSNNERMTLAIAERDGCKGCHHVLDYAMAAFAGWRGAHESSHWDADVAATLPRLTKFYVSGHLDARGEGPANPSWLGQQIIRQPEFAACMVKEVTSFVYETQDVPFDVTRELVARFTAHQQMAELIEDAVVARAFGAKALTERGGPATDSRR